ncbi:MAG: TonB-dependent receptor [Tenuifilaceae bacterium]|jgi:outer membrane receptor protein involved in Fe transport|nr:TonB-dependent receptor [Tenuifilaceae bacterium]
MSRIVLLFFLLSGYIVAIGQSGSISGIVNDTQTSEGVPFVTVALYPQGSETPVAGVTTNINGEYTIAGVAYGSYRVGFSFIGYVSQDIVNVEVTRSNPTVSLAPIRLVPSSVDIEGVEVTAMARTMVNRLDRRTYRAEDFETVRGGNAADVLNRLPSVSVSPDGEVSVRGTTDFIVYLNGRPTQMEPSVLLAQLSANNIQSIDVITVPSAQYDAQGKGGIINITTKSSGIEGFSLSANGLLGGAPWGHRTDILSGYNLTDNSYGGGLNFTYGNNGWLFFGGVSYSWRDVNSSRSGDARILNVQNDTYKHMVASGLKPEWYENQSANFGLEAKLSERSKFSTSYYFGTRTEGRKAMYLYNIFTADKDKNPVDGIPTNNHWVFNPNEGVREGLFHTVNADYTFRIDKTTRLSLSGLYEHSVLTHSVNNPNIAYNPSTQELGNHLLHYNQLDRTPLDGLRFSVDFQKQFDNGNKLSLGVQPQFFSIAGGLDYDTLNIETNTWGVYTDFENQIDLTRGIYAGYIDYSGVLNNISYKAGLRLEYTDQLLNIDNPDYFTLFDRQTLSRNEYTKLDWFPSLHVGYSISEFENITLAASRRISRAPIKNMAPFLFRRHLEVYLVGDPALKPEYISNVELSYSKAFDKQRFTLVGFYRGVDNAVFRVNTVYNEELVLIRSFTNSGNTKAIGGEINANLEIGGKTKLFLGGSLYDYHVQADIFGFKEDNRSLSWSLKGNVNFIISRELSINADFDMRSAQVTAQGQNEMGYLANVAMKYSPVKAKGWNFTLRGLNILNSNTRALSTRAYDASGVQIFYQDTEYYWYGPIVEMGISYDLNWKGQSKKTGSAFGKDEF